MHLRDVLHDREAKTCTTHLTTAPLINPIESLKET
jgi:hypothetical protein